MNPSQSRIGSIEDREETKAMEPNLAGAVRREVIGAVMVVTVHNPPVNALSVAVRRGLCGAIEEAQADPAVRGVLLLGEGRGFIAGVRKPGREADARRAHEAEDGTAGP